LWSINPLSNVANQSTFECKLCDLLIRDIRYLLRDQTTVGDLQNGIRTLCDKIQYSSIKKSCLILADVYFLEVMKMIDAKIDPGTICRSIKMCKGPAYVPPLNYWTKYSALSPNTVPSENCMDCVSFVGDIQSKVSSTTSVLSIRNKLKQKVCARLPTVLTDVCEISVDVAVPHTMAALASKIHPNLTCIILGFCDEMVNFEGYANVSQVLDFVNTVVSSAPKVQALYPTAAQRTYVCSQCVTVIDQIRRAVNTSQVITESDLEMLIKNKICSKLSTSLATTQCDFIVQNYIKEIRTLLLSSSLNSRLWCQMFISPSVNTTASTSAPCESLSNEQQQLPKTTKMFSWGDVTSKASRIFDVACDICEKVTEQIERRIPRPHWQQKTEILNNFFAKVCGYLSSNYSTSCQNFVSKYSDKVIQLLESKFLPNAVCSTLKLCPASSWWTSPLMSTLLYSHRRPSASHKTFSAFPVLIRRRFAIRVIVLRRKASASFPLKTKQLSSLQLPTQLRTYKSSKLVKLAPATSNIPVRVGDNCGVCKLITRAAVDFVEIREKAIGQKPTRDEVVYFINTYCDTVMHFVAVRCAHIVHANIEEFVDGVMKDEDPLKMCQELGYCKQHNVMPLPVVSQARLQSTVGNDKLVCEEIAAKINFETQQEAIKDLTKASVCIRLKSYFMVECFTLLNKFSSKFVAEVSRPTAFAGQWIRLSFCKTFDSSNTRSLPSTVRKTTASSTGVRSVRVGDMCGVCKLVTRAGAQFVKVREEAISQKPTRKQIQYFLDTFCDTVMHFVATRCTRFVQENLNALIDELVEETDPIEICEKLKYCDEHNVVPPISKTTNYCDSCTTLVDEINKLERVQAISLVATGDICKKIPLGFPTECTWIVKHYKLQLLMQLAKPETHEGKLIPKKFCYDHDMCKTNTPVKLFTQKVSAEQDLNNCTSVYCKVCLDTLTEIKKFLSVNRTSEEIKDYFKYLYLHIPIYDFKMCGTTLYSYRSFIVYALLQGMPMRGICGSIHLCVSEPRTRSTASDADASLALIKEKFHDLVKQTSTLWQCELGQQFWCQSTQNARFCGSSAVSYCATYAWVAHV
jgi:hypothetical protein